MGSPPERLRPGKGRGLFVPDLQETGNGGDQGGDAGEVAAAHSAVAKDAEPGLDLVEPGTSGGGEVHMKAFVLREPLLDTGLRVGAGIVQDQMQFASGEAAMDELEEVQAAGSNGPALRRSRH